MDFSKQNVTQLRSECKKRQINCSNLKKNEMIDLLSTHSNQQKNNDSSKEEDNKNNNPVIDSEDSELKKIKERIERFACKKNGASEEVPNNVIYCEELQKAEERRKRFSSRGNK